MDIEKEVIKQIAAGIQKAREAGVVCGDAMDIRIRTDSTPVVNGRTGRSKRLYLFITKEPYPTKAYRWIRQRDREFLKFHKCYH